jgi:hypothetical protein
MFRTAAASALLLVASASIAAPERYQMTGPITEITDEKIVIEKDGVSREFKRAPETKVEGYMKVGEKITVRYELVAVTVDAMNPTSTNDKSEGSAKKSKSDEAKPKAKETKE